MCDTRLARGAAIGIVPAVGAQHRMCPDSVLTVRRAGRFSVRAAL